ncbi:MAG: class IV adenylate cyclase [Nitrospirae bacterium]|nr:MAG: class IV adenylate cyclase [Nitrospirota bacterium]
MQEIEVKILEIDREVIQKKLTEFGARLVFDGLMHAIYYDSADRSLKKHGDTLRLRREGSESVLAFKRHISDDRAKVREEKEVGVSDFDAMASVLTGLGFSAWLEMRKHRTSYLLDGLHFELDKYHGAYDYIPEFLEIEGSDIATIHHYAGLLGYSKEDCRPWDAVQLAAYYAGAGSPPA